MFVHGGVEVKGFRDRWPSMFHGKHPRRTDDSSRSLVPARAFPGDPGTSGPRSSGPVSAVMTATPVSAARRRTAGDSPSSANPTSGQRPGSCPRGARSRPVGRPGRRKPTADSAVTAGGPNPRATTRSNPPRRSGSRARSSARPGCTSIRPPRSRVDRLGQAVGRAAAGVEEAAAGVGPGQRQDEPGDAGTGAEVEEAVGAPGPGGSPSASERSRWSSTGPGPRRPIDCARSSTRPSAARAGDGSSAVGTTPVESPPAGGAPRPPTRWTRRRTRRRRRARPCGRAPASARAPARSRCRAPAGPGPG